MQNNPILKFFSAAIVFLLVINYEFPLNVLLLLFIYKAWIDRSTKLDKGYFIFTILLNIFFYWFWLDGSLGFLNFGAGAGLIYFNIRFLAANV